MIKQKLGSTRGAAMIFAMVAMLVAVMVSALIIFAATSNAGRVRRSQQEQQAYLTVSSAAELLRSAVSGDSVTYTVTDTETTVTDKNGLQLSQNASTGDPADWTYCEAEGGHDDFLAQTLEGWVHDTVTYGNPTLPYSDTLTLSSEFDGIALDNVRVDLQMLDNSIVAVVGLGKNADPNYTMSLTFTASLSNDSSYDSVETVDRVTGNVTNIGTTVTTYTVSWKEGNAVIEKGDKLGVQA